MCTTSGAPWISSSYWLALAWFYLDVSHIHALLVTFAPMLVSLRLHCTHSFEEHKALLEDLDDFITSGERHPRLNPMRGSSCTCDNGYGHGA
jgi:hypothetical protein